ncbi:MAG: type IVB secretion system apparatus protein IcmL/DotI [Alphaproteobacteria bacterium]|nr:type IVB secretion system apparatus protein IcmL/DotI [Alphaproteobacteria bacterium]
MTRPSRTGEAEHARHRYRAVADSLRRAQLLALLLGGLCVVSVLAALGTVLLRPGPVYFATDTEGRITPLVPVSEPWLTDAQVIRFATEAVTQSLTITFSGWREDLTTARHYYEQPAGWNSFVDAVETSGLLDFIRNRRLNSSAVAQGAVIVNRGTDAHGRHSWILQVPVSVTYESAVETSRETYLAELRLVRLPTIEAPTGVGVARLTMRAGGSAP